MPGKRFHGPWAPVPDAASWVVYRLHDGSVVLETYSRVVAEAVDRALYGVVTITQWLAHHVREVGHG